MFKCDFGNNSFVYLGHIVEGGQLKIDPSKVDVIVKWPKPANFIEVQKFLGALQYLKRFIANLFFISSPLHSLTNVNQYF